MQFPEQRCGMLPSPLDPFPGALSFVGGRVQEQNFREIRLVVFPNFLECFTMATANLLNVFLPLRCFKKGKIDTTIQPTLPRQCCPEQFQTFFQNVIRGKKTVIVPISVPTNTGCPRSFLRFCQARGFPHLPEVDANKVVSRIMIFLP